MRVRWFGQSAFLLSGAEQSVMIDPFGSMDGLRERGLRFDYPPIEGVTADVALVTHEHADHNAVDVLGGSPHVLRSTAGTLESPLGEVVAVASEHDEAAGTQRGPNTVFVFTLDGMRVCHFGDFGQASLRREQRDAIGGCDLLLVPVGGGPTIGADSAAAIVSALEPRWVVPMHYRTDAIDFGPQPGFDSVDRFLDHFDDGAAVERVETEFDTSELPSRDQPTVVVPAVPRPAA